MRRLFIEIRKKLFLPIKWDRVLSKKAKETKMRSPKEVLKMMEALRLSIEDFKNKQNKEMKTRVEGQLEALTWLTNVDE